MDSPGWTAQSPPKFSEEIPDIVIDEQEYDRLPRSTSGSSQISVFVGGLDYGLESRDLENFFSSKGCKVSRVRVLKSNGKSMGKAFMNVADEAALTAVIKLSGSVLSGREIVVREDSGPKPARKAERLDRTTSSKMGGRWREEEKPKKGDNGWHAVSKGGKIVDAPAPERRKKMSEKPAKEAETVEEAPKERKKLELKPRSKPLSEQSEVAESARSSAIFGGAKPRDERAFAPKVEAEEPTPVETRRKKADKQPVVEASKPEAAPEPKPTAAPKKKKSANRFAVDSSSESSDSE